MITIGFTGTRNGMTETQRLAVDGLIQAVAASAKAMEREARGLHGDCVGADADFAGLCAQSGLQHYCRPCTFDGMRANVSIPIADPLAPMQRNRKIVADATVMIACPPNREPIKSGSGSWATIGFALKAGRPLAIIYPEGDVEYRTREAWADALGDFFLPPRF